MTDEVEHDFATLQDLKNRWPDFPPGADDHAETLLKDASQYIVDVCPEAMQASEATRRRVVCAVVKRSMNVPDELSGMSSAMEVAGGVSKQWSPSNGDGDLYLKKSERQALGCGRQKAFSVQVGGAGLSQHRPWCNLAFGAHYCSCGADIACHPIYEG